MKSISTMTVKEYDAMIDKIVAICCEPRDDWGITVRELAERLKISQRRVRSIVEGDDCLMLNVAMQAGSGIYNLALKDQIVEVDEFEYEEILTYRK